MDYDSFLEFAKIVPLSSPIQKIVVEDTDELDGKNFEGPTVNVFGRAGYPRDSA